MALYYIKQYDNDIWYGVESVSNSEQKEFFQCKTSDIEMLKSQFEIEKQNYIIIGLNQLITNVGPYKKAAKRLLLIISACMSLCSVLIMCLTQSFIVILLLFSLILGVACLLYRHCIFNIDTKRASYLFYKIAKPQVTFYYDVRYFLKDRWRGDYLDFKPKENNETLNIIYYVIQTVALLCVLLLFVLVPFARFHLGVFSTVFLVSIFIHIARDLTTVANDRTQYRYIPK